MKNDKTMWATARYWICKDGNKWAVFDNQTKKIVEGGFFQKGAARDSAEQWNIEEAHRKEKAETA